MMYDFLLYLVPQVAKFPKGQRYLLGERLELLSFDHQVLMALLKRKIACVDTLALIGIILTSHHNADTVLQPARRNTHWQSDQPIFC